MSGVATIRPWSSSVGDRYWNDRSRAVAPAGTSIWKANTSTGSRRHGTGRPPAVTTSPAKRLIWPDGLWLPGSHFG